MRPVKVTLNALGFSPWIPIDYIEAWFGTSVAVIPSEDGNLTYSVQHTFDFDQINPAGSNAGPVTIARVAAVATVTDLGPNGIGHGVSVGDSAIIKNTGSASLDSPKAAFYNGDVGVAVVSTPSPTTFTYAVPNSGPLADGGAARVSYQRVFPHATLVAQTTRQTGTYNYPVRAIRLSVTAYVAGFVDMIIFQGHSA